MKRAICRAAAFGVFTATLAAASIQSAIADTWDVPFLGDRIQVKAHPDNQDATFTVSDHAGDAIEIPAESGCDMLPCGFDKPEGARSITVESENPIFVISRTREGRLLPAFRRGSEPPDCEARREADETLINLAQPSLTNLYVIRNNLPEGSEQRTEYDAVACSLWSATLASARTSLAGCSDWDGRDTKISELRNSIAAQHCEATDDVSRSPYIWNVPFIGTAVYVQGSPGVSLRKDRIRVIADNRNDAPLDVLDDCSTFPCGFTRPSGTKFLRIESDDPLFVAARAGDSATGRTFPVYNSAPDWQDCATRQADDRAFLEETDAAIGVLQDTRFSASNRNSANSAICRLARQSLVLYETNLGHCPAWEGRSNLRRVFDQARRRAPGCYTPPRPPTPPPATPTGFRFANPSLPAISAQRGANVTMNFEEPVDGTGTLQYSYAFHPPLRLAGRTTTSTLLVRTNRAGPAPILIQPHSSATLGSYTMSIVVTDANGNVAAQSIVLTLTAASP